MLDAITIGFYLLLQLQGEDADGLTVAAAVNAHPELFATVCFMDAWLNLVDVAPSVYMTADSVKRIIGNVQVEDTMSLLFQSKVNGMTGISTDQLCTDLCCCYCRTLTSRRMV